MDTAQILPKLKRVSCSGSFLEDFVEKFSDSCHVRDIQARKYLMANYHMISTCGLKSVNDIIGFTQHDVWFDSAAQKKRNLSQTTISSISKSTQLVEKIEEQVLLSSKPMSTEHFILNDNGTVRFENILKIGVQTHEYKTIAFLSIFINLTDKIPLHKIFRIYQEFYSRKEAVQNFLRHFNIERYFDPLAPLTHKEAEILISMRDDPRSKSIARKFGIAVTTASNHISHIRSKLASSTLYDVLLKLPAVPKNEHSMYAYI